jgi:hypothetical protein
MSANNIDDLLQQDDAVAQLNEWEVKDVWCRIHMAHKASRALLDDLDAVESNLQNYHSGYLIDVAIRVFGKDSNTASVLSREDDPRNIERLFDQWTTDSTESDDATVVDVAKERIKTTLRGSGMARMKVARGRVEYHTKGLD